jgi:aldose 1-epimerase
MIGMPIPLTGTQYEIAAGDYFAVVTELGAGLRQLHHRGEPLLAGYQAGELPPAGSGALLIPWPNRVDRGQYSFDGREFQLDISEPPGGNAIHGLTRWANWRQAQAESDRVLLQLVLLGRPGYPFCLLLTADYRLDPATGLHVKVTARNEGTTRAPYGTGSHPYLTAGTPHIDECELTIPASRWLPSDERGIPSGPPQNVEDTRFDHRTHRLIGTTKLDHAFTGLERDSDGLARVHLTSQERGVCLWVDEAYRWLQVFTGDPLDEPHRRRALAVEPMTCPPNAFVSGTDLLTLEPGDTVSSSWGVQARPGG